MIRYETHVMYQYACMFVCMYAGMYVCSLRKLINMSWIINSRKGVKCVYDNFFEMLKHKTTTSTFNFQLKTFNFCLTEHSIKTYWSRCYYVYLIHTSIHTYINPRISSRTREANDSAKYSYIIYLIRHCDSRLMFIIASYHKVSMSPTDLFFLLRPD